IYARQSIDKQDSISIETQIDFCKKEIKTNEPFKVYEDKGFSGKNTDRPQFKKLMSDIKKGNISQIIVYRLDRISRSITDFSNIMDILEEHKVSFISANEKFDTSTPTGKAMLYIIMIFAQLERETIAERIKDNYYSRGKTGVWLGGPAPFGYTIKRVLKNSKKISVLESTKDIEIVKEIYNLYANTEMSLGGIAKILLEKYPDTMWNNIKLSRILHNPAYVKSNADVYNFFKSKKCNITNDISDFTGEKGCALYGKRDRGSNKYRSYEDMVLSISNHNGIIDSDTWLKCQFKLENNVQIKNTGKGKHTFLTGLLKCGYCGYSMSVKAYKEQKYFCCTGR
ncbi:MAG: recombinase family protein, partial [Eubacteriales bacterium]|nr:recombinase family protein [Eubacteriales bacterium]